MTWAAHLDDERSKKAHPLWYRFGGDHAGVLYFTFKREEDVPAKCDCGNDFYIVPGDGQAAPCIPSKERP